MKILHEKVVLKRCSYTKPTHNQRNKDCVSKNANVKTKLQKTPSKLNICILNRVKGLKMSNSLNKKSMKCYTQKMLA